MGTSSFGLTSRYGLRLASSLGGSADGSDGNREAGCS